MSSDVIEILENNPICTLRGSPPYQLKEVYIELLTYVLNEVFTNAIDMQAVTCLFFALMMLSKPKIKKGVPVLSSESTKDWLYNMKKLSTKSVEGVVYFSNVIWNQLQVVMKSPRKSFITPDLLREYCIGMFAINPLRLKVPTFMYTLGAFWCKPPKYKKPCANFEKSEALFTIYEKIEGKTVEDLIQKKQLTFAQFLNIYIQLLLSLEIAQRECNFTHFDLHNDNVMIRYVDPSYIYPIYLDQQTYFINTQGFLPTIIDFGLASAKVKDKILGHREFEDSGMLDSMVPGYDMYKFLIYALDNSQGYPLQQQILNLFYFYGDKDPYSLIQKGEKGLKLALKEYNKRVTFSDAGKYTPKMFLEWILTHYYDLGIVHVESRRVWVPILNSPLEKIYSDLFSDPIYGNIKSKQLVDFCVQNTNSYIYTLYNLSILKRYAEAIPSLTTQIQEIETRLDKNYTTMIANDVQAFQGYKQIKFPTHVELNRIINGILQYTISPNNMDYPRIDKSIVRLDEQLQFVKELQPYLYMFYSISQMNPGIREYEVMQQDFVQSPIYFFYIQNITQISQANRWSDALKELDI